MNKKVYIIMIIALFLIGNQPVRAGAGNYSWYNARVSLDFAFVGNNGTLTADNFSIKDEGLYYLQGDRFVTTYTGLIRLSGTCYQAKPFGQNLVAELPVTGRLFPLAFNNMNQTYTFSVAFHANAEPVILRLSGNPNIYNETKCNILFEAV